MKLLCPVEHSFKTTCSNDLLRWTAIVRPEVTIGSVSYHSFQQFQLSGTIAGRTEQGRSRITTPADNRYVVRCHKGMAARRLSLDFAATSGTIVSRHNVLTRLVEKGLYVWKLRLHCYNNRGECVYGADNVATNYLQFWFRRFRSGFFDVKDALHTSRPIIENADKITEIIEVDRHVSSRSIAQEPKIDHKTVSNHLRKVGFEKNLDVWVHTN
ncbi:histone-lysine N-methyltransferase SETMAR [Trichonephila clavipes]|nr:histone-lysine N-methyltransferase SETMAR [Trichonephila clavipes]